MAWTHSPRHRSLKTECEYSLYWIFKPDKQYLVWFTLYLKPAEVIKYIQKT